MLSAWIMDCYFLDKANVISTRQTKRILPFFEPDADSLISVFEFETGFIPVGRPEFGPYVVRKTVRFRRNPEQVSVEFPVAVQIVKTTHGVRAGAEVCAIKIDTSGSRNRDDFFQTGFFRL